MFTKLGFATLLAFGANGQDFTTYQQNGVDLDYRVFVDSTDNNREKAQYKVRQSGPVTIANCPILFNGLFTTPDFAFPTPDGLFVECQTKFENGRTFAQATIAGLPQVERIAIRDGRKDYRFVQLPQFSANYAFLAAENCIEPCVERYAGDSDIKYLTYNAYTRVGQNIGLVFADDRDNTERANLLPAELEQFDIVGLQEFFAPLDAGRKEKLLIDAKARGFEYYSVPAAIPSGESDDGGLAILSKFPIVETAFRVFTNPVSTANRGI